MPPPGWAPPGMPPPGGAPYPPPGPPYQPPPGYLPRVELRPGIIPLRPLGLGDVFGAVTKTIRGNVAATIGLAFLATLIVSVPSTALGAWLGGYADPSLTDTSSDSAVVVASLGSYIPTIAIAFAGVVLTGFIAYVVGQAVLGRRVSAGETWDGTRPRLLAVIGASLLTGTATVLAVALVVTGPVLLLVVGSTRSDQGVTAVGIVLIVVAVLAALVLALFLWTRFAFPTAVIVLERVGVIAGIRRSWALTSGQGFWRILGIRILTAVIVSVASSVLTVPISLIGFGGVLATGNESYLFAWQAVITGLTGLITGTITTPLTAGVDAVLYVDQRIRREGLDVALIQAAQGAASPPWPSAARR